MGQFSNRNFGVLEDLVSTKYGDLTGLIQIDGHNNVTELYDLCAANDISRNDYFIIGFGLSQSTISGLGEFTDINCSVLLLETSKYGNTFDIIEKNIKNLSTVDVVKKNFHASVNDIGKYLKRVDTMLLTEMGNYIQNINLIEE